MERDWKSCVVLVCITCEDVALLSTNDKYLRMKGYDDRIVNLFLPTVCFSCEHDEKRRMGERRGSDKEGPYSLWNSLSISWNFVTTWPPYASMVAYLRDLSMEKPRVRLVRRDEVKEMFESKYTVQSVSLNDTSGKPVRVLPYLRGGFF